MTPRAAHHPLPSPTEPAADSAQLSQDGADGLALHQLARQTKAQISLKSATESIAPEMMKATAGDGACSASSTNEIGKGDERHRRAADLYLSGLSVHQVAPLCGVTSMTIHGWLKKLGIPRRSNIEASKARVFELRSLNQFEIRGDVAVLFFQNGKGEQFEILIDAADLPLLQARKRTWRVVRRPHTLYAKSATDDGRDVYLHQFLMGGSSRKRPVDHYNGNGLDNRRSNLRLVSQTINNLNRKGARRGSRSGLRGVGWSSQKGKWVASVTFEGKSRHLGTFEDKLKAAAVVTAKLLDLGVIRAS